MSPTDMFRGRFDEKKDFRISTDVEKHLTKSNAFAQQVSQPDKG